MKSLIDLLVVSTAMVAANAVADVLTTRSHFNAWERELAS